MKLPCKDNCTSHTWNANNLKLKLGYIINIVHLMLVDLIITCNRKKTPPVFVFCHSWKIGMS